MNIYDFVEIESNDFDKPVDEFIKIAKRHNNTKREFLFVNTLLGKHIATYAKDEIDVNAMLYDKLETLFIANNWNDKKVLVVGFAETATALAQHIMLMSIGSKKVNSVGYVQTTREEISSKYYINIAFEEEHSHATTQKLYFYKDLDYDIVVFIDDEITTGKTILNFIDKFEKYQPNKQYIVASILNWQNDSDRQIFKEKNIYTVSLVTGKIKDNLPKIDIILGDTRSIYSNEEHYNITLPPENNFRTPIAGGMNIVNYMLHICDKILKLKYLNNTPKETLVIGTEENMFIPMWIASYLHADVKATTRSPIEPSLDKEYPISSRLELNSAYDSERITYLYNIDKDITIYDRFIIVVEEESPVFEKELKDFLEQYGEVIIINQKELLKNEE
jgi:hypothetical protein